MDLPTALVRDLLRLEATIDGDVGPQLTRLVTALRTAAPSYRGLDLTVHIDGHPVSLTAFLPREGAITTSLRLPFTALASDAEPGSRVIFYAEIPGAFVDLAVDLERALNAPTEVRAGEGRRGSIVLDADLPPRTEMSRLTGLDEVSTINRAIGMLIDQGHHPDDAHATLRRHAAAAGVDTHIYAARLLRR